MKRTERLFALAEALRARRTGVTAEELAERFGVTIRTIYRDLSSLRAAELPLSAERGRGGGYALDRSYRLPPVNFTAREAAVLVSAGLYLERMRVIPFADTLRAGLDKVRAALDGSAQRELLSRLSTLEFVGVPARPVKPEVRAAVEQAWFERQPLRIHYLGRNHALTWRRVRIRQVVMDRSETLLNCEDLDLGEPRQFRMHFIEEAEAETGP